MNASIHGYLELIEYLIYKGADINAKDNEGNTVLGLAEESLQEVEENLLQERQIYKEFYEEKENKLKETIRILKKAGAK